MEKSEAHYVAYAEQLIEECDGTHPSEFVKAKALLAIAVALTAIAKREVDDDRD